MANTLTNLIPTIRVALDRVSRELIGFIPASMIDASAERAAVGQTIRFPIAPAATSANITAGQLPPDTGDQTIGSETLSITKSKAVPVRYNGEEELSLREGTTAQRIRVDQFAQAFRTLANEVETDLAAEAALSASRAYGTAGTAPFASSLNGTAGPLQILRDNGAPMGDLQLVMNTAAGFNMRSLSQLTKVNEAGTEEMLRSGMFGRIHGFAIRESGGIASHTKGTGASYAVDLVAGYAVGDTAIHVDTGTGTCLAGDVVTFAGDNNKYIVQTGFAGDGDSDLVLCEPGLRQTLADGVAMTIGNSFTPNVAFDRSALVLLARQPALPEGGDSAADRMSMTDPVSGITFDIAVYREYHQVHYEIGLAWGVAGIKREHAAILLG